MRSSSSGDGPLLGGFPFSGRSSSLCPNPNIGRRSLIALGLIATSGVTFFSISYLSVMLGESSLLNESLHPLSPPPSPPPHQFVPANIEMTEYDENTCVRLDTPFEFESPPDFTKLGIESWTDCREVKVKDGWKVEHCTAPGSTWRASAGEVIEDVDTSYRFLFRPEPRPEGQKYAYMTPPTPRSVQGRPPATVRSSARDKPSHCNPSGYFRIKRVSTPSTDYTLGSDNPAPELRCRNNPGRPISLNNATRDYVDNFAGPDTLRVVLDGPEYYVSNQQINLGDCTYAIPYVLSRPGRFWLVQIEHGYDDYKGMNENFDGNFVPQLTGELLLPVLPPAPPRDASYKAYLEYKMTVAQVYEFTVCLHCQAGNYKYENWPLCSVEPSKAAREYGVLARSRPVLQFEDLSLQGLEWVAARPSCRYNPRLVTFESPEEVLAAHSGSNDPNLSAPRLFGSPPPVPATIELLREEYAKTQECLSHNRSIYFVGDSHVRQLLTGVTKRFQGYNGDLQDFKSWETHTELLGGVFIRQDFDAWFQTLPGMAKRMADPAYVPFSNDENLLDKFDTVVLEFGSWASSGYGIGAMWNSDQYLAFMKEVLWNMAEVRNQRRQYYQKIGLGYNDLMIIWMGMVAWPDTRTTPDMRTNVRMQYWDDLINTEIEKINEHYKDQGGMIDHLDSFATFLPFRKMSPDGAHHLAKAPVDAIVQVLTHKFDLCRAPFTPKYPTPATP